MKEDEYDKKQRRKGTKTNECRKGGATVLWGMQKIKGRRRMGRAFGPAGNGSGLTREPWVGSGGV